MICYYFKRKIDNLELAQSGQAKMLYSIIQNQENEKMQNVQGLQNDNQNHFLGNLDLSNLDSQNNVIDSNNMNAIIPLHHQIQNEVLEHNENDDDNSQHNTDVESDSDNDSNSNSDGDSDVDSDEEDEEDNNVENDEDIEVEETKYLDDKNNNSIDESRTIELDMNHQYNYEKMTIKELKSLLESRGNTSSKRNMKKQDLINILLSMNENNDADSEEVSVENEENEENEDEENSVHESENVNESEQEDESIINDTNNNHEHHDELTKNILVDEIDDTIIMKTKSEENINLSLDEINENSLKIQEIAM